MKETNNEGVDIVLGSLSEDKLKASIRCVRRHGIFLELGFNIINNTELGMNASAKGITIRSILVDQVMSAPNELNEVIELMKKDLACGIIQPLPTTVFSADDVENAFRYLASEEHIGKVVVQMRDQEHSKCSMPMTIWPKVTFDSQLVHILIGGLNGFGLELTDWMVMRGAKILVLCSKQEISSDYQRYRMK